MGMGRGAWGMGFKMQIWDHKPLMWITGMLVGDLKLPVKIVKQVFKSVKIFMLKNMPGKQVSKGHQWMIWHNICFYINVLQISLNN
jgi:hypothetical protein